MPVIRIEPDERVKQDRCARCGGTMSLVLGFIYEDDVPHGIYYIDWCEGDHDVRAGFFIISRGDYRDETSSGKDRLAFAIEARCSGMALADTPIRDRPDFLGRFVPRDEALAMPSIRELWHIADHICAEDPRAIALTAWLCGGLETVLDPSTPDS
jgi:hypothetical protein